MQHKNDVAYPAGLFRRKVVERKFLLVRTRRHDEVTRTRHRVLHVLRWAQGCNNTNFTRLIIKLFEVSYFWSYCGRCVRQVRACAVHWRHTNIRTNQSCCDKSAHIRRSPPRTRWRLNDTIITSLVDSFYTLSGVPGTLTVSGVVQCEASVARACRMSTRAIATNLLTPTVVLAADVIHCKSRDTQT